MALYGDLTFDSRVQREARTLAEAGYDVVIFCLAWRGSATELPHNARVVIVRPSGHAIIPGSSNPYFDPPRGRTAVIRGRVAWLLDYVRGLRSWGREVVAIAGPLDIWHAHDLTGLAAISSHVPADVPIVYDSHELFLETGTALRLPGPVRSLLRAYERRLVRRVALVVTVNDALGRELHDRYHPRLVVAVHNCPNRWAAPDTRPDLLRDAAAIPTGHPVLLYHGALSANRGIEQLMSALLQPGLESTHLVLLGYGELRRTFEQASTDARWRGRIHVLEPVSTTELPMWVASADVGVMPIQPTTLNHRLSTPNKLFECLAAGIPVVASDFPGMHQIVCDDADAPLGIVCDPTSVASVAAAIRTILRLPSQDGADLRDRCRRAAAMRWNWETESLKLLSTYSMIATTPR